MADLSFKNGFLSGSAKFKAQKTAFNCEKTAPKNVKLWTPTIFRQAS